MATTKPRPPTDLDERGRAFWRAVHNVYSDMSPSELALLEAACRTLDAIDQLERQIAKDGTMISGASGQPVLHPALAEARQQRLAYARLLDQLGLPSAEDSEAAPSSPRARAARKAAE